MRALAQLGLEWARPSASWALALAPLFLVFVRLAARPPEVVIGTLALWQRGARPAARGARGALAPWVWCCAGGLLLGALAWSGPRRGTPRVSGRWTCVVDRSPSMALALGDGRTRLEAALSAAQAWLGAHAAPLDRVRWTVGGRAALELARDERPGAEWFAPQSLEEAEPEWERCDEPGTLWLTDRAPELERGHAGLFASGGPAVPGAIHADGRETLLWDGSALRSVPTAPPLTVALRVPDGARPAPVLERALDAWCAARGLERARGDASDALFVVELGPAAETDEALELARDGWRARGVATALPAGAGEDWLVGTDARGASRAVVRARAGWIGVGLSALDEPAGDPARFALSWARLFERSALVPAGVVALGERRAAGAALALAPEAPLEETRAAATQLDALLALCAGLCAGLALLLRASSLSE